MSFETGTATDVADFLLKLDAFLLKGHSLEPAYAGVGDGTITLLIGTGSSVVETITITFTSSTAFDVVGSVTGALGSGTVGVAFTSSVVDFTIVAGGTAWAAADTIIFAMTPPWVSQRAVAGSEHIWKAPGNDNAASIYVGVLRFNDVGADYDNLRLGGFTGFDPGQVFAAQPGAVTRPVLPLLRVGSMPYWFVANGRRAVIIAKVSSTYESAYLGFIDSYANPNQFAYPLAVGGSMAWNVEPALTSANWRWSHTGTEHSCFVTPAKTTASTDNTFQLRFRHPSGNWEGYSAHSGQTVARGLLWPYSYSMLNLIPNLDGGYALFPVILHSSTSASGFYPAITIIGPQMWGELDGIAALTGDSNASENTITIGRTQWLVVQNIFRTTKSDFFAVKLA